MKTKTMKKNRMKHKTDIKISDKYLTKHYEITNK